MSDALDKELQQISTLLDRRLNLSGERGECLLRARKHLNARMRRVAETLIAAEASGAHPRLAVMRDEATLLRKARGLRAYLETVDLAERRKGRLLDIGASVGFAILAVIALFVLVLRWQGFI